VHRRHGCPLSCSAEGDRWEARIGWSANWLESVEAGGCMAVLARCVITKVASSAATVDLSCWQSEKGYRLWCQP
jgi:hypothetical protein